MKSTPDHRSRFIFGTALAVVVGVGLASMLLSNARRAVARERTERSAIISTLALSDVVSRLWDEPARIPAAVMHFSAATGSSARVVGLDARTLMVSSFPIDIGSAQPPRVLSPDSRADKAIFDRAQTLRSAVSTNKEEESAQRAEMDISLLASRSLSIAAPIQPPPAPATAAAPTPADGGAQGGDEADAEAPFAFPSDDSSSSVAGIVEVQTPPAAPAPGISWPLALLAIVLPIALVASAALLLGNRRWALAVISAILTVAAIGVYDSLSLRAVKSDLRAAHDEVAGELGKAQAYATAELQGLKTPSASALDSTRWNADHFRQPIPADSDANKAAQALGQRLGLGHHEALRSFYLIAALALVLLSLVGFGVANRVGTALVEHKQAYLYILPAVIGTLLLVFFPFFYGIALSFTDQNIYNSSKPLTEIWIGLKNYIDIVGDFAIFKHSAGGGYGINYLNFYWTLLFTIFWTITNVAFGVTVGLVLALVLNQKIAARPVYRVLLILPWAMPNYITALVWKGMFHQQFGVVNQVLQIFGGHPISWFDSPFTSFLTAFATNGWLSFPFMMVVSLGALQSIPADIYEAARVDGASKWQQFKSITLPSLKPALVPAIILSVVWTFNMFNIIYLVTGGEPGSATEILITQAYKYAFERYRYGYAAAYSTVIFGILLVYGYFQNRMSRATEAA